MICVFAVALSSLDCDNSEICEFRNIKKFGLMEIRLRNIRVGKLYELCIYGLRVSILWSHFVIYWTSSLSRFHETPYS